MMKFKGFIMNRLERYNFTTGDAEGYLTYLKLMSEDGIKHVYATGEVAQNILDNNLKGETLECFIENKDEVMFGKPVTGRIVSL